jgi:hypothetical protein
VLVKRGNHNNVLNTPGMRLGGLIYMRGGVNFDAKSTD